MAETHEDPGGAHAQQAPRAGKEPGPEGGGPPTEALRMQEVDADGSARAGAGSVETIESLRADLDALRAEKDEQFRAWQRTQADFVNYRRRSEQERAELVNVAEALLIRDLLPVLDDLERGLGNLSPELKGLTWVDGILLIERKLAAVLEAHGLTPIEALGKEFDPHQHEAVLREGEPGGATIVTGELQKGYRLHDHVLRPTLVKVGQPSNSNMR